MEPKYFIVIPDIGLHTKNIGANPKIIAQKILQNTFGEKRYCPWDIYSKQEPEKYYTISIGPFNKKNYAMLWQRALLKDFPYLESVSFIYLDAIGMNKRTKIISEFEPF